jgi:tartrate/fumarate subfamily iron-sulfur-dependent hydro-lyase beta chain
MPPCVAMPNLTSREEVPPEMQIVSLPLDDAGARGVHVGDEVLVRGRVVTAAEPGLRHLLRHDVRAVRETCRGALLFHAGPVVTPDGRGGWRALAVSTASSMRAEPYQGAVLARYGLRGVIGKGGMGPATLAALRQLGAVYLHAAPGLAVARARCVRRVEAVHGLRDLGASDVLWVFELEDLPAVVSMDAHGETLHAARGAELAADDAAVHP